MTLFVAPGTFRHVVLPRPPACVCSRGGNSGQTASVCLARQLGAARACQVAAAGWREGRPSDGFWLHQQKPSAKRGGSYALAFPLCVTLPTAKSETKDTCPKTLAGEGRATGKAYGFAAQRLALESLSRAIAIQIHAKPLLHEAGRGNVCERSPKVPQNTHRGARTHDQRASRSTD